MISRKRSIPVMPRWNCSANSIIRRTVANDVTAGEIYLDGKNIRELTLKSLRRSIGVVQQEVYLFSGTPPEGPTRATFSPGLMLRFRLRNTWLWSSSSASVSPGCF